MPKDAMPREIVILSGARTAIGTFGGSLAGTAPTATGALVAKEAMARAGVDPKQIGHVAYGHVINTEPRDMYLSRVSAIEAGIPEETPAMNVNRLCGSGAQAIVSAAQSILLGDAEYALAGGAEAMSRGPYILPSARFGQKMGDMKGIDMMVGALNDPFGHGHMGITAENVAAEHQIGREEMDAFALESQTRAKAAIEGGRFADQIVPVEVKKGREMVAFDTDEHPRMTSAEALAGLKPVFRKDGMVTAGNASGINDGAAAVVLMKAAAAEKRGIEPLARIVSHATAGLDPRIMGMGPVHASRKALDKAGWKVEDLDLIEANEAFAAQACAVNKDMGWDPSIVNVNGGAIAIGHPIGASGARVLMTLLYEMQRRDAKKGLATLCIGGGMGVAMCVERG